ncbi:hypothetical protein EYF80_051043 [Liparis tanakae]|uniref:Uncharacterized protein n=1 Tax=Liparis tanakae TaxID=230148 RepID=A0A4Z2FC05_9TELE|nr:hypothetical protein EYF80_051043 [Liparis tanakae]
MAGSENYEGLTETAGARLRAHTFFPAVGASLRSFPLQLHPHAAQTVGAFSRTGGSRGGGGGGGDGEGKPGALQQLAAEGGEQNAERTTVARERIPPRSP